MEPSVSYITAISLSAFKIPSGSSIIVTVTVPVAKWTPSDTV